MNRIIRLIFLPVLICLTILPFSAGGVEYNRYHAGIHFDSNISGGYFKPAQLAEFAEDFDFDAIIFADHDRMTVEYGVFPLRKLLKKKETREAVDTYGFDNYIYTLDSLDRQYPNLTVIPGLEIGPYYYWTGSPISKDLALNNWHQHMMVFGLESSEDYAGIPTTSAKQRGDYYWNNIDWGNIKLESLPGEFKIDIMAALLVLLGIILFFIVQRKVVDFGGQMIKMRRRAYKVPAVFLIIISIAFLALDYPFKPYLYSAYNPNLGEIPAQGVINYVNSKGGLVYYAHPEADADTDMGAIHMKTMPYMHLLLSTHDYTGFAIFGEGWKFTGDIGGNWDLVLRQYCESSRDKPVWIIGESDFEGDVELKGMREVTTYVWAQDKSRKSIMEALSAGRCYATQIFASNFIWLDEFYIRNESGDTAISGETVKFDSTITLRMKFTTADDHNGFEAMIIRNGEQLATAPFDQDFQIDFTDEPPPGKNYYRLWVLYRGYPTLATNPIFIIKN
ncbi:hypothetical protein ISS30_02330 [bacterium]|nr:hypothetical protein [bacterium]